jgi:hypothetical protein
MDMGSLIFAVGSMGMVYYVGRSASGEHFNAVSVLMTLFVVCVAAALWCFDVWSMGGAWWAWLLLPPLLVLAAALGLRGYSPAAGGVWQSVVRGRRAFASVVQLWGS